ncbi:MAG: DNA polymerase IV [Lachnospiraceae bacterium]
MADKDTHNRIFFHIDVNSAFLSWTSVDNLERGVGEDLRLVPSIIGGDIAKRHGIVLAKSMPAKKFLIQTGEPIVNAMRKCPSLLSAPPNHALYQEKSRQLFAYLSTICPDIEQLSIDECYMDYTPISHQYESPLEAANAIRISVYETFGFTVNIGISDKKVLAKMASDFKKPNLVHTLYQSEIQEKMWPLPVSALYMCGNSSTAVLHKLGIVTIGELAFADPDILVSHLKSHGRLLWEYANGYDDSLISTIPAAAKGIGNSITLTEDVITIDAAQQALLHLSESVAARLRADRHVATVVCVEIKYSTFQSVSHQANFPIATNTTEDIYTLACRLFHELWDLTPIRLLGIRATKLIAEDNIPPQQLSLFDTVLPRSNEKQRQLDGAIDSIRQRYGSSSITRGSLLHTKDSFHKH